MFPGIFGAFGPFGVPVSEVVPVAVVEPELLEPTLVAEVTKPDGTDGDPVKTPEKELPETEVLELGTTGRVPAVGLDKLDRLEPCPVPGPVPVPVGRVFEEPPDDTRVEPSGAEPLVGIEPTSAAGTPGCGYCVNARE